MIRVKLKEALAAHAERTGQRMSYRELADAAGVSQDTIASIAARPHYSTSLDTVDAICGALGCSLHNLLERTGETGTP